MFNSEVIFQAFAVGGIYALAALCYNITFLGAGLFNFAQGQFVMLGTFLAFAFSAQMHLPVLAAIPLAAGTGAIVGITEYFVAIAPLGEEALGARFITTLGIFVAMEAGVEIIWGSNPLSEPATPWLNSSWRIDHAGIPVAAALLLGVSVALAVATRVWKNYTRFGIATRAALENREAASLRGINTKMLAVSGFAASGAVAGALGILVGVQTYAVYNLAEVVTVYGFAALAIGGFGSELGSILGGLMVGLVQAEATRAYGIGAADPAVFILLLVILVLRPQGLFARGRLRQV